jgi:hypothetical protein
MLMIFLFQIQFVLSLLLSSLFVYNSLGTIDSKALDGLHYATEIG